MAKPPRDIYGGLRLRTTARLAGARIAVIIDIGFGDAIEPGIEEINLPVLLNLPRPRLRFPDVPIAFRRAPDLCER